MGALVSPLCGIIWAVFAGVWLTCHLDDHRLGRFLDPLTSMYHSG